MLLFLRPALGDMITIPSPPLFPCGAEVGAGQVLSSPAVLKGRSETGQKNLGGRRSGRAGVQEIYGSGGAAALARRNPYSAGPFRGPVRSVGLGKKAPRPSALNHSLRVISPVLLPSEFSITRATLPDSARTSDKKLYREKKRKFCLLSIEKKVYRALV